MTQATRFQIVELTGSQRSIELAGWAGPKRGVSFGIEMATKKTTYPGNPRSTIQVLGPDWLSTPIRGRWSDRYLVNGQAVVQVVGFPDLESSPWAVTDLVAAFYSLAASGNALRVSWYNEVREGVMTRFVPTYGTPTGLDVEWECEFEWQSADATTVAPVAAPVQQEPRAEMRGEMNRQDVAASRRPTFVLPDIVGYVSDALTATRMTAGTCFDSFRTIARIVSTGQPPEALTAPVAAVIATTGTMVNQFETEFSLVVDPPRSELTDSDEVTQLLALEAWRLDLAYQQSLLRNGSMRRARAAAQLVAPGNVQLVNVGAGASLRQLAFSYYGTADAWQRIADANGLPNGTTDRAMTLIIPPPGA